MREADNLPPYCAVVKKSGNLNFLDPSGPARPVTGVLYIYLYLNCLKVDAEELISLRIRALSNEFFTNVE